MGQGQSSGGGDSSGEEVKVDYYELLGVERQASDEEIKKSYRRKALELHPDRNYGDVERATKLFAEIQSAYEVLSDPQERAWYDSHRDVFLRGSQPGQKDADEFFYNVRMTTADDLLKKTMKYAGRVDYGGSSTGFYGGLQELFAQLAREEEIACSWENMEPVSYPDFGFKDDDYNEVVRPFYAAWSSFATGKSYSWKDRYRLSEAPDRRVRRLLEKENRSLRDEGIREFNDAVRSLVAFVRKRDPRYQENQQSHDDRQKKLRNAAAAQSARSRAAREAKLAELEQQKVPAAWAGSRAPDERQGSFSSVEGSEKHEIECVVCSKTFKSEAQYVAHEKSKKHIKQLKQLRREMREQDQEIGHNVEQQIDSATRREESDFEDGDASVPEGTSLSEGSSPDLYQKEERRREVPLSRSPDHPAQHSRSSVEYSTYEDGDDDDDDYASRSKVEDHIVKHDLGAVANQLKATGLDGTLSTTIEEESSSTLQLGKAKQKRAKKAAQKKARVESAQSDGFRCAVCQAVFPSKTKLFKHIQERDHAAPVTGPSSKSARLKKSRQDNSGTMRHDTAPTVSPSSDSG